MDNGILSGQISKLDALKGKHFQLFLLLFYELKNSKKVLHIKYYFMLKAALTNFIFEI